jgi:N-acetylmuramoyl-L-alanine amidase
MVALGDLANAFQLTVQTETLGAITVSYRGKTIVLTPDQNLASVDGRIVSLPAPATKVGNEWLVPIEFIARALAPIYGERLELRADARVILEGSATLPAPAQPPPTQPAPSGRLTPLPTPVPSPSSQPSTPSIPPGPPPSLGGPSQPSLQTIVIDPGHGGADKGVQGPHGTLEKDLTMVVARRLKSLIEGRLGIRVLLTRDGDQTLSADERAALANNNKADLFLSLHANASFRGSVQGAEVCYVALDRDAAQASAQATAGAQQLPVIGGSTRQVEIVPWQFAQTRFLDESKTLAGFIARQFQGHVPLDGRGLSQAPLRVLVGANMPAVLVEMGYLSNPDQENQLGTGSFQNTIAQALYAAIVQFRDSLASRAGNAVGGGGQ